jgi:hypothetical protein
MLLHYPKTSHAQVLIDLASLPVLAEQATENALAAHPEDLGGHTSLCGTLALTRASVTAFALGSEEGNSAGAGVDSGRLDDDAAVLDKFLDVGARVGVADLSLLIRVEPDFALADAGDGRSEPLLRAQVDHRATCLGEAGGQRFSVVVNPSITTAAHLLRTEWVVCTSGESATQPKVGT